MGVMETDLESILVKNRWLLPSILKDSTFSSDITMGRTFKLCGAIGVIAIILLFYLDEDIIQPHVLPADPCYYHLHKAPWWVNYFYLPFGNNGHTGESFKLMFIIIILGFLIGHFTSRKIRRYHLVKKKRVQN